MDYAQSRETNGGALGAGVDAMRAGEGPEPLSGRVVGPGTFALIVHLSRAWRQGPQNALVSTLYILRLMLVLITLHGVEAGLWALLYWVFGLFSNVETALYFSLTSYTTLGYGDVLLPVAWRLFGPLEAAIGILMFGWSTGVMVAAITMIYGRRLQILND
jgi:hypothetical protein